MDLSKLSTEDLENYQNGNIRAVSDSGLSYIQESEQEEEKKEKLRQTLPKPSQTEAAMRGFGQGGAFNLSEEAIAALKSLLPGKTYKDAIREERIKEELSKKEWPKTYGGANIGGVFANTAATSLIPGVNVANAGRAAALTKAALVSGAQSGLSEIGNAEDKTSLETLKNAALATGTGTALGAGGEAIGRSLRKAAPGIAEMATGATGREVEKKFKEGSGEFLLKNKLSSWFSNPANVHKNVKTMREKVSSDIGESLKNVEDIDKDQILAHLVTEKAKIQGNSNRIARAKVDKEIAAFAKGPDKIPATDLWKDKIGYENKVNFITRKEKPNLAQASDSTATALRDSVVGVAESQSPELAEKFALDRNIFGILKPVEEATSREASRMAQRKIGGYTDMLVGVGTGGLGAGASMLSGRENALENTGIAALTGGLSVLGSRYVLPRVGATIAKSFYEPYAVKSAVQTTGRLLNEKARKSIWDEIQLRGNK